MTDYTLPTLATPVSGLKQYLAFIRRIELLSPVEEQKLALQWFEDGDKQAAQALVMSHLRFVVYIARSYNGYGLPLSDLIQEGNVGLMKAVKKFNPHRGVRLITFAVFWIRSEIHEYIIRNWKIVKVATTKSQRKLFFKLRSNRQRLSWLNDKEIKAIAADLKVPERDVREMEKRLTYKDISFNYSPQEEEDGESEGTEVLSAPEAYLADNSLAPAVLVEQSDWEENLHQALTAALQELDPRSKKIIEARWLSPTKLSLKELAATFKVSTETVRQLEKRAFNAVRKHLQEFRED